MAKGQKPGMERLPELEDAPVRKGPTNAVR